LAEYLITVTDRLPSFGGLLSSKKKKKKKTVSMSVDFDHQFFVSLVYPKNISNKHLFSPKYNRLGKKNNPFWPIEIGLAQYKKAITNRFHQLNRPTFN
jgi:hypothetical protein